MKPIENRFLTNAGKVIDYVVTVNYTTGKTQN